MTRYHFDLQSACCCLCFVVVPLVVGLVFYENIIHNNFPSVALPTDAPGGDFEFLVAMSANLGNGMPDGNDSTDLREVAKTASLLINKDIIPNMPQNSDIIWGPAYSKSPVFSKLNIDGHYENGMLAYRLPNGALY